MASDDQDISKRIGGRTLQTIGGREINENCLPYRLYQKAKKFGQWNPANFDFSRDIENWEKLDDLMKKRVFVSVVRFLGGDEAVTFDLLPLISVVANTGNIEETMYLATFLLDEAKHVEFFDTFLKKVVPDKSSFVIDIPDNYKKIFCEELPYALDRLTYDPSPEALAMASVTYHIIVEDILAQFSFDSFYNKFGSKGLMPGLMPGLMKGIDGIKTDESRHITYGTYLLQRLICEHDHIWDLVCKRIEKLLPYCIGMLNSTDSYRILQKVDTRLKILQNARGKNNRRALWGKAPLKRLKVLSTNWLWINEKAPLL